MEKEIDNKAIWITNTLQKFSFGSFSLSDFKPPPIHETLTSDSIISLDIDNTESHELLKRNEEFNGLIAHAKDVAKRLQHLVDRSEASFRKLQHTY